MKIKGYVLTTEKDECPHDDGRWEFHETLSCATERKDALNKTWGIFSRIEVKSATLVWEE